MIHRRAGSALHLKPDMASLATGKPRVPTLLPDLLRTRPIEQPPPGIIHELHTRRDMNKRLHCLREANGLQQPHHLVVSVAAFRSIQSGASRWVVSWITIFSP